MNKPAPFSMRQYEYMQRCLTSWFNVAEGGKRGGKNVLQTLIFCMLLEEHENKICRRETGPAAGIEQTAQTGYILYSGYLQSHYVVFQYLYGNCLQY